MRRITSWIAGATALQAALVSVVSATELVPEPRNRWVVGAEIALSGAATVLGANNLVQARRDNRSIRWGLASIAVGVCGLGIAASNDAVNAPVDVIAASFAILGGVSRIPRFQSHFGPATRPAGMAGDADGSSREAIGSGASEPSVRLMAGFRRVGVAFNF